MAYRVARRLLASDVDIHRRLRLSRLAEMVQEATIAHTEQLGAGRALTLDRGLLWVVVQLRFEIVRLPAYDEDVVLTTWPGDMMHVLFPRFSLLCDTCGAPLVRASALWMLMGEKDRRMAFPEEQGIYVAGERPQDVCALPSKLHDVACTRAERLTVPVSLCDLNGHLSNTRVTDLADDRFGRVAEGAVPRLVEAEFAREVTCGSVLELAWADGEASSYLGGTVDGSVRLRVRYTW